MKRFADSKWIYIVLSVCVATIFWMYVRSAEDPPSDNDIRNIPVVLTGENVLENQGLTIKEVSHDTVDLNVTAPLSMFRYLRSNNMSISLDVSKLSTAGAHELKYNIVFPENVNVDELMVNDRSVNRITVFVDKLNSKTFEIEPKFTGSIAEGYQAGKWSISQSSVVISGSAEQVSQVAHVEAVLSGENATKRIAEDVPLTLLDHDGNVLKDLDVKLSIDTVYVMLPVVVVKEIPLTVKLISGGGVSVEDTKNYSIEASPKTITVSGEEADVEKLTEISLGSIDLSKVIGTSTFTFPVNLDPALENVSGISQTTVKVSVHNLHTRTFYVEQIDIIPPAGRNAEAVTQVSAVVVRGKEADLELLDQSQMRIVADLSDVTTMGSFTVPVKVYLNASDSVGVIGEYHIVVKVY